MRASLKQKQGRKKELEERINRVAKQYGLDIEGELDEVGVKYLGTYVNAQASKQGTNFRIDFDSTNFFKMNSERQRRTILHELIHIKQFNNSLSDWAKDEFNASEELAEKLDGTIWEDVKSIEGETELILSNFFPEEESSYPYARSRKEKEFESIDLDEEFDTEDELDDIIEEYKLEENSWKEEDMYLEEGEFKGEEYSVAVFGADNPEEKVEEYLVDTFNYGEHNQEIPEYNPGSNIAV